MFLDVDGVLNTRPGSLDGDKVALVHGIISLTECVVVLSSAWRKTKHQFDRISREIPIHDCTPVLEAKGATGGVDLTSIDLRSHEIKAWLDDHPGISRYVAVDDGLNPHDAFLFGNVVVTSPRIGLTPVLASRITQKLNL